MTIPAARPQRDTTEAQNAPDEAPALEQQDWNDLDGGELEVEDIPGNGDVRYEETSQGELPEEDDDNAYQESDEALPEDVEERTISRNPSKEGGLFDEA